MFSLSTSFVSRLPRSRGARTAAIGLVSLGWLAAAFLAGEIAVRLQVRSVARRNRLAVAEMDRRVSLVAGVDLNLWQEPGRSYQRNVTFEADVQGRTCRITTNGRGFRGAEVVLPKPPGLFHIVCVGSSTTVEGWTDESTYPARLQAMLAERLGPGRIDVVNAGISSYTTAAELARFEDYLALDPDLIVEYGAINDVNQMVPELHSREPRAASWLRRSVLLGRLFGRLLAPSDDAVSDWIGRVSIANLAQMGDRCAARGVRFAIAGFATVDPARLSRTEREFIDFTVRIDWEGSAVGLDLFRHWIELQNRQRRELCARRGLLHLPVEEEMPGEMSWYQDLCHMSDAGIERKAEILARHLEPEVRSALADAPAEVTSSPGRGSPSDP